MVRFLAEGKISVSHYNKTVFKRWSELYLMKKKSIQHLFHTGTLPDSVQTASEAMANQAKAVPSAYD